MGIEADLVIRGGAVIDGTGRDPMEADVAVKDGRIAAVGEVRGSGREEIDARGRVVTPGFVDVHTHYDGQAVWDSQLAPSSQHGVTTVVMGNCGVGFAPVRAGDHETLIELMEGVEDIPGPVLHQGLEFRWESFAEYLDVLDAKPRDIDVCALVPHAAVRVYIMGKRALDLEPANQGDIAAMRAIVAEAVRAGAFGFSTSRTISHKTLKGDFTPTLRAQEDELTGIALGMRDIGAGFLELVSDWNEPDPATEFALVRRVVERSGRPLLFSLTARHDRTEDWRKLLALSNAAAAEGLPIRPVFPPRPIGILLGLQGSQNPFSGTPQLQGDRAPAARGEGGGDARPGGARAHPLRGPGDGEHLPAHHPPLLRAHVPLQRSAGLHAGARELDRGGGFARGADAGGGRLRHAAGR